MTQERERHEPRASFAQRCRRAWNRLRCPILRFSQPGAVPKGPLEVGQVGLAQVGAKRRTRGSTSAVPNTLRRKVT